jgi:hypothetical protein
MNRSFFGQEISIVISPMEYHQALFDLLFKNFRMRRCYDLPGIIVGSTIDDWGWLVPDKPDSIIWVDRWAIMYGPDNEQLYLNIHEIDMEREFEKKSQVLHIIKNGKSEVCQKLAEAIAQILE